MYTVGADCSIARSSLCESRLDGGPMALTPIAWANGHAGERRLSGAGRDGLVCLTSHGVAASERWLVVPCGEGEQLALARGF